MKAKKDFLNSNESNYDRKSLMELRNGRKTSRLRFHLLDGSEVVDNFKFFAEQTFQKICAKKGRPKMGKNENFVMSSLDQTNLTS